MSIYSSAKFNSAAPLVVIVGPTASGKTGLAIELARAFNGEIICADSRTIYTGMDIGTAKPTAQERALVPHWGLDLVQPGERFTAADFKHYAIEKIVEIRARGKIPFVVGGTGLYVDALVLDYNFGTDRDEVQRKELEALTTEQLQKRCKDNNISLPENIQNRRHLVRAIEQVGTTLQRRSAPIDNSIVVGIATEKDVLRTRIRARAEQLFKQGVIEEAIDLAATNGWESEAMTGNIYRLTRQYVEQEITYDELVEKFITSDWKLAKRQLTWLRRNNFIQWHSLPDAKKYLELSLAEWSDR